MSQPPHDTAYTGARQGGLEVTLTAAGPNLAVDRPYDRKALSWDRGPSGASDLTSPCWILEIP